jgi:hypothetical protein
MGDSSGPSEDNVHEQAWKNHLESLAVALLDGLVEHPVGVIFFVSHVRIVEALSANIVFPQPARTPR